MGRKSEKRSKGGKEFEVSVIPGYDAGVEQYVGVDVSEEMLAAIVRAYVD